MALAHARLRLQPRVRVMMVDADASTMDASIWTVHGGPWELPGTGYGAITYVDRDYVWATLGDTY